MILLFNKFFKVILFLLGICFLGLCIYIGAWILFSSYFDHKKEARIEKYFYEDIADLSDVTVHGFKLWEGDSIVELDIKDKGEVMFFYGEDRIPRIMRIGNLSVGIDCQKNGKLEYTSGLNLSKNSQYKKWFSFDVLTIRDLVSNYDKIFSVVKTLPNKVGDDTAYMWKERHMFQTVECGIHQ